MTTQPPAARTGYTPGPWAYRNRYSPDCGAGNMPIAFVIETHRSAWDPYAIQDDDGTRGDWVAHADDGREYSRIADTSDGGPEAEANARLIAAAPELREALSELLAMLEGEKPLNTARAYRVLSALPGEGAGL